jgi:arginyl-tRNA synthetase
MEIEFLAKKRRRNKTLIFCTQTLQSVKKTGTFYTMYYYADYSEIVQKADRNQFSVDQRARTYPPGTVPKI